MKIAILCRPGPCFPHNIADGLGRMLEEIGVEHRKFPDAIAMLMRILPITEKSRRWHNNLHFRLRNKCRHFFSDRMLLNSLAEYDAVVIAECYANAFWRNYLAVEALRRHFKGPVISYSECPLDAAPVHRTWHLAADDYDEERFDFNLFVTDKVEVAHTVKENQAVIGVHLRQPALTPQPRDCFRAVIDFAQPGYEAYRRQQLRVLQRLGIETIILQGRYPIEEIRRIYGRATVFFLAFPESVGLSIAECLACGTIVAVPSSAWPMAWRQNADLMPMAAGSLPSECFLAYGSDDDLTRKLLDLRESYDTTKDPIKTAAAFKSIYPHFYEGNKEALAGLLRQLN